MATKIHLYNILIDGENLNKQLSEEEIIKFVNNLIKVYNNETDGNMQTVRNFDQARKKADGLGYKFEEV